MNNLLTVSALSLSSLFLPPSGTALSHDLITLVNFNCFAERRGSSTQARDLGGRG
jgi:hypothetical protein